jgi:fructokinase
MDQRKIYILGETTYDVIFKNNQPADGMVGGSQLNTAISLGRLHLPVHFISQIGNDQVGKVACHFLVTNGVSTDYIVHHENLTRLSLAFINDQGEADYSFYNGGLSPMLKLPLIMAGDIIMFGSSFALRDDIRNKLIGLLVKARKAGAYILYDPNFRKSYVSRLPEIKSYIDENIEIAHLVRGSDEDFRMIFKELNPKLVYNKVCQKGSKTLIITRNKKGIDLFVDGRYEHYEVPQINPINTIGAGDAFNAAIVFCLYNTKMPAFSTVQFSEEFWETLISIAIKFSQHTCMHHENYISCNYAQSFIDNIDYKTV